MVSDLRVIPRLSWKLFAYKNSYFPRKPPGNTAGQVCVRTVRFTLVGECEQSVWLLQELVFFLQMGRVTCFRDLLLMKKCTCQWLSLKHRNQEIAINKDEFLMELSFISIPSHYEPYRCVEMGQTYVCTGVCAYMQCWRSHIKKKRTDMGQNHCLHVLLTSPLTAEGSSQV